MLTRIPTTIYDERAEGTRPDEYENEDIREQAFAPLTSEDERAAMYETGVIKKPLMKLERREVADFQDASLTMHETQPQMTEKDGDLANIKNVDSLVVHIVEDMQDIAQILMLSLSRMNIHAIHDMKASIALERFNESWPDLILLDIQLPDMTGWRLLDQVKELARKTGNKMPAVIVITGHGDPANRVIGKLHEVNAYLVKPMTQADVQREVSKALQQTPS